MYLLAQRHGLPVVHALVPLLRPFINPEQPEPLLVVAELLFILAQKPPVDILKVVPNLVLLRLRDGPSQRPVVRFQLDID